MAYQVTLRMQNGVERDVACYGYECHIAHSDRPDIGRIIAAHMEACQKLGTADYLPVEGDLIALTFESTDHDNFFYEWLLQGSMANGEIEFATGDDIVDIFRFWDCYCVSLEETLCTREMPMLMTVLLSPGILKRMNCEPREKVWKVSDISVKLRVVDNDEKHNSEPMVLVTSVKGESKAIVSQTVQYVVTKYSVSNVKDSDRKRVKWVIEVDGQKEYLKEQGETLDLQIKEEWVEKEIIIMPYLQTPTINVSKKTKVQCKHIDGAIEIAKYIVNEIKKNVNSQVASSIRYWTLEEEYQKRYDSWKKENILVQALTQPEPLNLIKAKILWTERVFRKRPWDHKDLIRQMFKDLAVERVNPRTKVIYKSYYHKYKGFDYFYDVWSNIHYGYVGLSVGFDEETLLDGADLAQIIDSRAKNVEDTDDDKISIKIGFALYYKYGRYAKGLTAQAILDALDSAPMTESKLKHICLK